MSIQLPKQDSEGLQYISYSQINAWNTVKGFNTGLNGKLEYIRSYFLGERFPEGPFATFGKEVENYITSRQDGDKFTEDECKVLETIEPLGNYQTEIKLQYDGFYILMYVDDHNKDYSFLRDYKTASEASSKKYYEDEYEQLDLYSLGAKSITGKLPSKLEVCCIERSGNGFKEGRSALKVAGKIWYIERKTNEARLATIENKIQQTVQEISDTYNVFKKLNK